MGHPPKPVLGGVWAPTPSTCGPGPSALSSLWLPGRGVPQSRAGPLGFRVVLCGLPGGAEKGPDPTPCTEAKVHMVPERGVPVPRDPGFDVSKSWNPNPLEAPCAPQPPQGQTMLCWVLPALHPQTGLTLATARPTPQLGKMPSPGGLQAMAPLCSFSMKPSDPPVEPLTTGQQNPCLLGATGGLLRSCWPHSPPRSALPATPSPTRCQTDLLSTTWLSCPFPRFPKPPPAQLR